MSASVTSMRDFIEALRAAVPRDLHPMRAGSHPLGLRRDA